MWCDLKNKPQVKNAFNPNRDSDTLGMREILFDEMSLLIIAAYLLPNIKKALCMATLSEY